MAARVRVVQVEAHWTAAAHGTLLLVANLRLAAGAPNAMREVVAASSQPLEEAPKPLAVVVGAHEDVTRSLGTFLRPQPVESREALEARMEAALGMVVAARPARRSKLFASPARLQAAVHANANARDAGPVEAHAAGVAVVNPAEGQFRSTAHHGVVSR